MNDDVTRRGPLAADRDRPGNLGPADPTADPATDPGLRRSAFRDDPPSDTAPTVPTARPTAPAAGPSNRTIVSGLWIGLVLSAVVLVFLLIFILQNQEDVQVTFLGATGELPTGVALLLAAVAGVLVVAIPGTGRILQLRRAAHRARQGR